MSGTCTTVVDGISCKLDANHKGRCSAVGEPDDVDRRTIGQVTYESFWESLKDSQPVLGPWGELPEDVRDAWEDAGEEAVAHRSERCNQRLAMAKYCVRMRHHDGKCVP